jgi:hypothetical protein
MGSEGPSRPSTNAQPTSAAVDGTSRPPRSREESISSQNAPQQHLPTIPSGLRQIHMPPPSPEDRYHQPRAEQNRRPNFEEDGIHPASQDFASIPSDPAEREVQGKMEEPSGLPNARTSLLDSEQTYHLPHNCGEYNCDHGSFSPRPRYHKGYGSISSSYDGPRNDADIRSIDGYGGPLPAEPADMDDRSYRGDFVDGSLGDAITDGLLGKASKRSTTRWLARRHAVKHERWMCVAVSCIVDISDSLQTLTT